MIAAVVGNQCNKAAQSKDLVVMLSVMVQVISRSGKTHYVQLKSWLTQRAQHAFALEAAQPILTESNAQEGDSLVLSHLVPGTLV